METKVKSSLRESACRYIGERARTQAKTFRPQPPAPPKKKITIIGSTQYKKHFYAHKERCEKDGCEVFIPAFDDTRGMDELQMCAHNRGLIEMADEVHIIWDARSVGTVFDFGMAFALRKKVRIIYIERKTIAGVMYKYADSCWNVPERTK